MSCVSVDVTDHRDLSTDCLPVRLVLPTSRPSPRNENRNRQAQSQPDRSPPLGVKLTPFHLLSLVSIAIFGIWRLLLSYYDQWVVITRVELVLVTIAAVILYYLMMINDNRPQLSPRFFQVDLAPPIGKFLYRSEVYLFILSLLPLWPVATQLRSALDVRQGVGHGNRLPGSYTIARNALVAAIVGLIFASLAILQQFAKVVHLRALHRFLARENVSFSLLAVWAVSNIYVLFDTVTSINYFPKEEIDTVDEYLFGHTMAIIPFALLLPRVEKSAIGPLWFRLLKGFLIVVLLLGWSLCEKFRNPYYGAFVCGIMVFFLSRIFIAAFLQTWRSSNRRCLQDDLDSRWW